MEIYERINEVIRIMGYEATFIHILLSLSALNIILSDCINV